MDRVDLTEAALEALQPPTVTKSKTPNHDDAHSIRGKILGVLLRMYRLEAERSLADCAAILQVEPQLVEAWEYGDKVPSLPQLEVIAHYLNGRASDTEGGAGSVDASAQREYLRLRRRLVGGMLRAARETAGQSVEVLSAETGLEAELLESYELGEARIPVGQLARLAQAVKKDLSYFAETAAFSRDPAPSPDMNQSESDDDAAWRQFTANRENRAFIRLAMAFQQIERDDLHRIADALFAIIKARGESNGWSGSPS
ncbi:MAG: helix-turn-helix transcriptional regulator [Chloroflexota bacterium]|nr:helix-turn-helix transcriptional regulator [Chloroflexota bacterium]MDE2947189.1 helix-turn-helix transcriptional regulator [Chloroflexota bacterium]